MKEDKIKNNEYNCLTSTSFKTLGIFTIIFELVSLIMSIICLVKITWDFLKNFTKILNIII